MINLYTNNVTKQVKAGDLLIGGGAPISIQSMLNVKADNIEGNKIPSWFSWSSKSRVGSGMQEPALSHLLELLAKFLRIL